MLSKKRHFVSTLCIMIMIFFAVDVYAAEKKPVEVKKDDKCQVCGMFVARYSDWIAQVIFKDKTYAVFDGPKDMFKYYFNMAKYAPGKKQEEIDAIYVTEYYSAKLMEAKGLLFIKGSDVYGPMGHDLVPVASAEKAKEFMKDHKGKKVFKFSEITSGELK